MPPTMRATVSASWATTVAQFGTRQRSASPKEEVDRFIAES